MDQQQIDEFIQKFLDNCYTDREHQLFIDWLKTAPVTEVQKVLEKCQHHFETMPNKEYLSNSTIADKIESKLNKQNEDL